jgi:hypothetical protein
MAQLMTRSKSWKEKVIDNFKSAVKAIDGTFNTHIVMLFLFVFIAINTTKLTLQGPRPLLRGGARLYCPVWASVSLSFVIIVFCAICKPCLIGRIKDSKEKADSIVKKRQGSW